MTICFYNVVNADECCGGGKVPPGRSMKITDTPVIFMDFVQGSSRLALRLLRFSPGKNPVNFITLLGGRLDQNGTFFIAILLSACR